MSDQSRPQLGATFTPGGFDDYFMPEQLVSDVVSPAPQRFMPEVPGQIQDNLARIELDSTANVQHSSHPQLPMPASISAASLNRATSTSTNLPPQFVFPRLPFRTANVPPSDEEKEVKLEADRVAVLGSNDPENQLAWAADVLIYADISAENEMRLSETQPRRPSTPPRERQLRTDALNVAQYLAEQHHPRAEFLKGQWLEFGKFGFKEDKNESLQCYDTSAKRGYARAEYRLGMQFESSNQPILALQHYKAGEAAGDAASCYRMGMTYLLGQMAQPRDPLHGLNLVRYAADFADENAPQGAYVYGMLLAGELPQFNVPESLLPRDEAVARTYLEKSAFLGFSKAQLKMGSLYELGALGCSLSPLLSLHYNLLAANQGELEAEMALSRWFLCGFEGSFPKNEEVAFKFARRAAQIRLPSALFAVGYYYEVGIGVPRNIEKATLWYQKAVDAGDKEAPGRLRSIANSSTMSKEDHETMAVSRIRSTHGSRRGQRLPRLASAKQPPLPTVADEDGGVHAQKPHLQQQARMPQHPSVAAPVRADLPVRSSSALPYPSDVQAAPLSAITSNPAYDRPANHGPRPGAGYNAANVNRPNSTMVDQRPPPINAASKPLPLQHGTPPLRPMQNQGSPGRGMAQYPIGPAQYPYAPAPGQHPGPNQYPSASGQHPVAIQYPSAPGPHPQYPSAPTQYPPGPNQRTPNGPPSGYRTSSMAAPVPNQPPKDRTPHHSSTVPYPQSSQSHQMPPSQFDPRYSQGPRPTGAQSPRLPPHNSARPGMLAPGSGPNSRPNSRPNSPSPMALQQPSLPNLGAHPVQSAGKPTPTATPAQPARRPGKGPSTFEEMGIPQQSKENDCILM